MSDVASEHLKVEAFGFAKKSHESHAKAQREEADREEEVARDGWERVVAKFSEYLAKNPSHGGVPLIKSISPEQVILLYPDGTAYVRQIEGKHVDGTGGVMVEHNLGIADEGGWRDCEDCGWRVRLPHVDVAPLTKDLPPMELVDMETHRLLEAQ